MMMVFGSRSGSSAGLRPDFFRRPESRDRLLIDDDVEATVDSYRNAEN